jgi:signal peptidase I
MGKTRSISPKRKSRRRGSGRRTLILAAVGVVALVLAGRAFLIQGVRIPSRSMEDSLLAGDYLLIDKLSYGVRIPFASWSLPSLRDPSPGDIVAFEYPEDPSRIFVKRCIAVAGQTIEVRDKAVYVDGERLPDPPFSKYVDVRIRPARDPRDNLSPRTIPSGTVFVMGDNRDNSRDSRHWGALSVDRIVGQGLFVYWSSEPDLPGEPGRVRWYRLGHRVRE